MKLGYPCINWTIGCKGDKTFRLKSYSEERLISTVENNLDCLLKMLQYNIENNLLFFRITSDLIPFASHPICTFNWQHHFKNTFTKIGDYIRENNIRISMHPDQFIVLNATNHVVVNRAIAELRYHADVLDLMKIDNTAKIQLHIGGVYNNKPQSKQRFVEHYNALDNRIKQRLVIENDDRSYSVQDCLDLHNKCGFPVLFDYYHHQLLNNKESLPTILKDILSTWKKNDGLPLVDYSSKRKDDRIGAHTEHIDIKDFKRFIDDSKPFDFDIMLEIKDKENSALKARDLLINDPRFQKALKKKSLIET
jgi:UV DNA damage endonuclease